MKKRNMILVRNEYDANRFAAKIMLLTIGFFWFVYVLNIIGVFIVPSATMTTTVIISTLLLIIPSILTFLLKVNGHWLKYINVTCAALTVTNSSILMTYHVVLLYIFAIAIASLYFSKNLNWFAVIITIILTSIGQIATLYIDGVPDLNFPRMYSVLVYGIVPRSIELLGMSLIFIALAQRTNKMLENVIGVEEQKIVLEDYIDFIENQKLEIENKRQELKNLMDNTGEGFLFFGDDLKIKGSYSLECELIFKNIMQGEFFSKLIFPSKEDRTINGNKDTNIEEGRKQLDNIFGRIIKSQDLDLYEALLPVDIVLDSKWLNLKYKLIEDNDGKPSIMVIVSDITDKKNLEEQLERERTRLRSIVSMLINRDEFLNLINEYESFISDTLSENLNNIHKLREQDEGKEFLRQVHTYRGNLAQYDLLESAELLNKLEEFLISLENSEEMSFEKTTEEFSKVILNELENLSIYVGKDFFKRENMYLIGEKKIQEIESMVKDIFMIEEAEKILPIISRLRQKSLKHMLYPYGSFCYNLASRQGKNVATFDILGDEIEVTYSRFSGLITSFTHIFRNAISHGIENPEERIECGKSEVGQITCCINDTSNESDSLEIIIQDDGKGIDKEKLFDKGKAEGFLKYSNLNDCPEDELLELIFKDGISTVESRNTFAGSGVGLSAVKAEVQALGGKILVTSVKNCGTTFIIKIPKEKDLKLETRVLQKTDISILTDSFLNYTEKYINKLVGKKNNPYSLESIPIEWYTFSTIETAIRMVINSSNNNFHQDAEDIMVIFSSSYNTALVLYQAFNSDFSEFEKEVISEETVKDALSEILNNICGNWSSEFEELRMIIMPLENAFDVKWNFTREINILGENLIIRINTKNG